MTIDDLLAKCPEQFRPIVARYGPALVRMTADEFAAWVELLIRGETYDAWRAVYGRLDDGGVVAAWEAVTEKWDAANARNADRLELQRSAAVAVLKVLLAAALAAVGL